MAGRLFIHRFNQILQEEEVRKKKDERVWRDNRTRDLALGKRCLRG